MTCSSSSGSSGGSGGSSGSSGSGSGGSGSGSGSGSGDSSRWKSGEQSSVLSYYYRIIFVCCIGALIIKTLNSLHQ